MEFNGRGGRLSSASGFTTALGSVERDPSSRLYPRLIKPILDRVVGGILLLVTLPIIIVAGLVILVTLGRPVLYSQERIGKGGMPFKLFKLRTMIPDRRVQPNGYNGIERRRTHKSPTDPRVSRFGRVLRAARLDELPQFWNVLRGDMSLVGPRPEMPVIVSQYEPWQHERHLVKPGVTGPWQISTRNGKLMHECTDLDIKYINQMSFLEDMRIIAKTPLAMIGVKKGY